MSLRDRIVPSPAIAFWSIAAVLLLAAVSPPLRAQDPTPLTGLKVLAGGGVQYSFFTAVAGCINLSSSSLATHTSKWQKKDGATWVDIPGTERTGLCGYSTTSPGEYRVVADLTINGQRRLYTSENTLIVQGTAATTPGAPTNLAAAAGDGQVTLNWTAPANDGGAAITGYQYRQQSGSDAYGNWMNVSGGASTSSHVVSSLTNGQSYNFQVRAVNSEGGGAASASASATPTAPVRPPGTGTVEPESFEIPNLGGWSITSNGTERTALEGYGRIRADAGSTTPSGIAIIGYRPGGVLVAEAGVPASELVREGRIFAEVNGPVNTGLAIANPNDAPATIDFYFTDTEGARFGEGAYVLDAGRQIADFLNETPFNGGDTVLGTFTFTSSLPIAVIALRGFTNRDGEFLMTTLPVAPLATPLTPFTTDTAYTGTVYFPHFADGSGWATQVILVNPTVRTITGTVRFLGQGSATAAAAPAVRTLEDGRTGSSFEYSIPPNGSYRIVTSNPTGGVAVGSVRAIPDDGHRAPSGLVIFSFTSAGKTLLEAGVPALAAGSAFRVYVESSGMPEQAGSIRTGVAITNAAGTANTVTLEVTDLDGTLAAPPATLPLPPSGQVARYIDEFFDSLPPDFSGVLRVTSTADVAIVGLRLRYNNRGELKMTTTPPSNETGPPTTADKFFPHIVDSAGWSTQFILFSGSAGQTSSGTLSFIDTAGEPWDLPTATVQAADTSPSFGAATVGNQSYQAGTAISPLTLPAASGGDGSLTYSLSPNVPGLTFNATARQLTGTPTTVGSYGMTYTVRDAEGDIATLNFVVTVVTTQMATVDLVVTSVSASDGTLESGQSFDLRATVRNAGTGASTATTLRYYRSTDATITTGDTEVGTDAVGALVAAGASDQSISFTAPSTAGTYYYGACVDPVSGESNSQNNCSTAVRVTVSASQMEIEGFDLASDNRGPEGIVFANDRFYVVDWLDDKVFAYQSSGQRDSASEFDLDATTGWPRGIAFANDRFYVADFTDDKVYAYQTSGQRDSASDFDLAGTGWPGGIAFANDRFYVVDYFEAKVYAYQASGQRDSASDFDLDSANGDAEGIAFANETFYVVDGRDDWVYAYDATGQRDSASDLYLDPDNGDATGITFANGRVYLVDDADDEVYVLNSTAPSPDLVISTTSVSSSTPVTGQTFEFRATVRNRGTGTSTATTLRYYRSTDSTISTGDTQVGTDSVSALSRQATSAETITLTAPSDAGTFYYGACVESVAGEPYTDNNCSSSQRVTVRVRAPDLLVESPSVSDDTPASEGSFEFRATVRNRGTSASTATTLRYYRSDDRTISTSDMEVGTDAVSALAVDGATSQTITLSAPTAAGTYYYGACVDRVAEESDTGNNCSSAVAVFGGGPFPEYDLDISSATLHYPTGIVFGSQPIGMSVTVVNRGPNRSQPAKLRFGSSTYRDIPALDSGATTTFSRVGVGSVRRGTLTFRACIVEAPGEENTANNCVSRSVTYN